MYCVKCGERLMDDAKFCHSCGADISFLKEDKSTVDSQENSSYSGQHKDDNELLLESYVGKNYIYYKNKWDNMENPSGTVSWNWASFFLGPFWLGYRKMYMYIVLILGLYIILDTMDILMGFNYTSSTFTNATVLAVYLLLGMFGNSLYYRHTNKMIEKRKISNTNTSDLQASLERVGGTSKVGVFATIGLMIIYTLIVMYILPVFGTYEIIFGTGENTNGVTGVTDTFEQDEEIYYEVDFGSSLGDSLVEIHVVKASGDGHESMYYQYEETIDPTWPGFYNIFYDPAEEEILEKGDYIVRAFDNGDLISEGSFTIE